MYRNSDLDYIKLHVKELYDEAERYRLYKNSLMYKPINHDRWYIRLSDTITASLTNWISVWKCRLQSFIQADVIRGMNLNRIYLDPCTCSPQPCAE